MVTLSEAFPSKYLKATDLEDGVAVATISVADLEKIKGYDGKEQAKVVVYFAKKFKPLILNRTNFESIGDIAGSYDTENWPGTKIGLYKTPVSFNGKTSDGIRIRKPAAEQKPKKAAAAAVEAKPDYDDEVPSFGPAESDDE
jgi:hypothetical protein